MRILLLAVMVLAGCSVATESRENETPHNAYEIKFGASIATFEVAEFRLKDGTRCVVVGGNHGRGITCQWEKANVE